MPASDQVTLADNFRSSEGVVELGRSVAERIPAGERLPKAMVAAGHQNVGAGRPARPGRSTIRRRRPRGSSTASRRCAGVAFPDRPRSEPRGLSWSDCAVLFRSVAKDAEPARRGAAAPRHSVRRQGPEPALRQPGDHRRSSASSATWSPRSTAPTLQALWEEADLLPVGRRLGAALARAGRRARLRPRRALGRLQHPAALPGLPRGARACARTRCRATRPRRELVFYQLGKFSQAISDFEQIYFTTEPEREVRGVREVAEHQAPDYYADVGRRRRLRHARRGHDLDRAPGQGDAVAGGLRARVCARTASRRKRQGGLGLLPRHPGRRDRRCRPLPRHGRGRDAPLLRRGHPCAEVPVRDVLARAEPALQRSVALLRPLRAPAVGAHPRSRRPTPDARLEPRPAHETPQVTLSFSELKYLFECPYQFKLRFLYGFNPPLHEALGYGKGLHDALSEVHKRALDGRHRSDGTLPTSSSTGT